MQEDDFVLLMTKFDYNYRADRYVEQFISTRRDKLIGQRTTLRHAFMDSARRFADKPSRAAWIEMIDGLSAYQRDFVEG